MVQTNPELAPLINRLLNCPRLITTLVGKLAIIQRERPTSLHKRGLPYPIILESDDKVLLPFSKMEFQAMLPGSESWLLQYHVTFSFDTWNIQS
jgi:hypothetical protein